MKKEIIQQRVYQIHCLVFTEPITSESEFADVCQFIMAIINDTYLLDTELSSELNKSYKSNLNLYKNKKKKHTEAISKTAKDVINFKQRMNYMKESLWSEFQTNVGNEFSKLFGDYNFFK